MTRRALLIGSQTGILAGVTTDVARLGEALELRGFETRRCVGRAACRAGIYEHYQRLVADTVASDPALVYYSGHGGLARDSITSRAYQFIVPDDMDQSTDADFRGILDLELSALLAALTEKTRNVTVILDCCHSSTHTEAGT